MYSMHRTDHAKQYATYVVCVWVAIVTPSNHTQLIQALIQAVQDNRRRHTTVVQDPTGRGSMV